MLLLFSAAESKPQQRSILSERIETLNMFIINNAPKAGRENSLHFLDTLFKYSLTITENNTPEALLTLTLATIPYDTVPIRMPFIKYLGYPLPGVTAEVFRSKVNALPSTLFIDSPQNSFGDKDKIAHFFASAFFSFAASAKIALMLGAYVEHFENTFVLNGTIDLRDLRINELGSKFGLALKTHSSALPSGFLPELPPDF